MGDAYLGQVLVISSQVEVGGGVGWVDGAEHVDALAVHLLGCVVFAHGEVDLRDVVDDIAFVDFGHLAANLVHEVVALVVAVDRFVQLAETLVGIGQGHRAAGLVEKVTDLLIVRDADFGILHHMLEVVVVEEIEDHRAQHLQLDLILVGVGIEIGFATYGLIDGQCRTIGRLSPIVFKDLKKAVEILRRSKQASPQHTY